MTPANPLKLPRHSQSAPSDAVELTQEQHNILCKLEQQIQIEQLKMLERMGVKINRDDTDETIKLRMELNNITITNATFMDPKMNGWYFYKGKNPVAVIYHPQWTPDKDGKKVPAIKIMTPEMCAEKLAHNMRNMTTMLNGSPVKK